MRTPFLLLFSALLLLSINGYAQQMIYHDSLILEGKLSRADIETTPWYSKRYEAYVLNDKLVNKLKKHASEVSLFIILGSWCSDSREHIPALLKVCDAAGITKMELIGVDKKKQCQSVDLSSLHIALVPLIIVYKNGKEVGRINESPQKNIEADLWKMLR